MLGLFSPPPTAISHTDARSAGYRLLNAEPGSHAALLILAYIRQQEALSTPANAIDGEGWAEAAFR